MSQEFSGVRDLLGDPIPKNFGMRGRPQHIPTDYNRNKVRLLLGFGWTGKRIAQALRITGKTLAKHYFRELRQRDEARPALEAKILMRLNEQADKGNVGAIKELGRIFEKLDLQRPPAQPPKREAKPERLGKKAAAEQEAQRAHEDSGWSRLVN